MDTNQLMAATQNLVQVPQEQRLQRTGEEKYFELALRDIKIIASSFDEIKEVLRKIMVKVGLRSQNWPSDIEKLVLVEHIVKEFGGNTLEEIKLAFDMAISGKLEDIDANCYENFSCLYFSKVMNAYRCWAKEVYKIIKIGYTPTQKIYTEEEILNQRRAEIEMAFQAMKTGHYPIIHKYFEEVLISDGFMEEGVTSGEFFTNALNINVCNIYKNNDSI